MHTGRNTKKRLRATATMLLFVGVAWIAASPAAAQSLGLGGIGAGAGTGDASGLLGLGGGGDGSADASQDSSMAASAEAAAEAAAGADINTQPTVDMATGAAMDAAAQAQGLVGSAAAQASDGKGAAAASWGLRGDADGSYDVILGVAYVAGVSDLAVFDNSEKVGATADVAMAEDAVGSATGDLEGQINGVIDQVNGVYNQLGAEFHLSLGWLVDAVGAFGGSVNTGLLGAFGFEGTTEAIGLGSPASNLGVSQAIAPPPLALDHVALPALDMPDLAVDQGGELDADVAAAAGAVAGGALEP